VPQPTPEPTVAAVVNPELQVQVLLGGADLQMRSPSSVRANQDAPAQAYGLAGDQVEPLDGG
jgi:hypothetical protein